MRNKKIDLFVNYIKKRKDLNLINNFEIRKIAIYTSEKLK